MGNAGQGRIRDAIAAIAAIALVALTVYALIKALDDQESPEIIVAAFGGACLAGLIALAMWLLERRDRRRAAADEGARAAEHERRREEAEHRAQQAEQAREQAEQQREERAREVEQAQSQAQQKEQEVRERDHAIQRERDVRGRIERARAAERDWNRELRSQVIRLHRERGALGDVSDIRQLVLRMAVVLVEADKGILLSREDEDGDGSPLDVVAHEGFANDPADSAVAHAFASAVIERDETVREDDSRLIEREGRTAADDEIDNLVAIPIYIADEFQGAVVCANCEGGFKDVDDDVLLAIGDHAGAVLENTRLHGALRTSYLATVAMLAEVIEAKDPFLRGHSDEVSRYVSAVAERLGLDPRRREQLVFGSLLHDVGKVGISERILLKPAALTPEERTVIQLHPRIGYRLVERVPALREIAPAILHHHERFDGDGYPSKLSGEQIPLEARIICVADSFSAMTAERPYRRRMTLEDACAELERCAGTQFDPEVVRVFVEEVRARPISETDEAVEAALANDPELRIQRDDNEAVLGQGPLAVTDNLTLLYSHRYFHEVAAKEAERARVQDDSFGVVLVEPSDIANINRTEGYAAGDEAIRAVASALQRVAVRVGGTACRHGGRRLALIVPGADETHADRLASEIAAEVGDSPRVGCGAAAWRNGESGDDVVARALMSLRQLGGLVAGEPS
jgi:HD-GYP domain-containing protein (c-di-GMP phosphodiesterase class II)